MSKTALHDYLSAIEKDYQSGQATEHTYRTALKVFIEAHGTNIFARNEPKRIKCGAPDYMVEYNNLTIGYVEAKDISMPLDKIEKDEQLKRYLRALDNLILTDYLEFRWYVHGEKQMTARLATPRADKRLSQDKEGAVAVEQLLQSFLEHSTEPINKPQDLAKRMARLAHMIRAIIITAFEQKEASHNLRDLYTSFQDVLIPDLKESEFADMFAQTMAYGLFAARYNHTEKSLFRREDAAKEIPRTNPFLRKLFSAIAGADLEDEPFVRFVDELAQVLAFTDIDAVLADFGKHKRQEDPIIHFYETFLAQYDPKLRELRGVYYTPEPVVSYIVRSVDHLLREHFDCADGLADTDTVPYSSVDENGREHVESRPRVLILDPATGTGTFLYQVIAHIRESYQQMGNAGMWSSYVRQHLLPRLFGFELLMAPYAMAHIKLAMQLAAIDLPKEERSIWGYDFDSDERLGIYLTNTLDEAHKRSDVLFGRYISDEANEAAKVKQGYPVMVILGNPPYSYESANTGKWISRLIRDYYQVDGDPLGERNPKGLQDDYVKFIRFAQWRIEKTGYGILAFITNHGYLDNPTFRGMRQSLMQTFDDIYILDLHGNSKKKERSPNGEKDENVFDIQSGVAIGIFIKRQAHISNAATVYHAQIWGLREIYEKQERRIIGGKYYWLAANDISTTEWTTLKPTSPFYLFIPQNRNLLDEHEQNWKVTDIFPVNSAGLFTARDSLTIHWNKDNVWSAVNDFSRLNPEEARIKYDLGPDSVEWQVTFAQKDLLTSGPSESYIVPIFYRPFDRRYTYYTGKSGGFICRPRKRVMKHMFNAKNKGLITVRKAPPSSMCNYFLVTSDIISTGVIRSDNQSTDFLFPLYFYPDSREKGLFDGVPLDTSSDYYPNFAPAFIQAFSTKLNMRFIHDGEGDLQQIFGPEDIFSYMYAIFHALSYRERYAEFLKIDFPRLPLTSNADLFRELCRLGDRLVGLHLMEKFGKMTTRFPVSGNDVVEKIEYTLPTDASEQGRVWINKTQYVEGVPPEVWEFHIGGYQVCQKWLKDRKGRKLDFNDIKQYQRMVAALAETIELMGQIDDVIDEHGGWPIQ